MADPHSNKVILTESALDILKTAAWLQKELAQKGLHHVQHFTPAKGGSFFEARNEKGRFVPVQQLKETVAEIVSSPTVEKPATLLKQFSSARQDTNAAPDADTDKQKQEDLIAAENQIADDQHRENERRERRLAEEHAAASANKTKPDDETGAAPEFNARTDQDADSDAEADTGLSISADLPDQAAPDTRYESQQNTEAANGYQMTEDRVRMVSRLADYSGGTRSPQEIEQSLGADFFHRLQDEGRGVSFKSKTSMDIHYKDGCSLNVSAKKGKLYVTLPKGQKLTEDIARDMIRIQKSRGAETLTLERKNSSLNQRALLFAAAQAEGMNVSEDSFSTAELQELFGVDEGPSVNNTENQAFSSLMSAVGETFTQSEDPVLWAKSMMLHMSMLEETEDGQALRPRLSLETAQQMNAIFEEHGITSESLEMAFDISEPTDIQSIQAVFDIAIEENIKNDPENAEKWQVFSDRIKGLKLEKSLLQQPVLLAQSAKLDLAEHAADFLTQIKAGTYETPAAAARKEHAAAEKTDSNVDDLADYGKTDPDEASKPEKPQARPPRKTGHSR